MSSTDGPLGTTKKMPLWKRLIVIGFSVGGGIVLAGLIVAISINWYNNRPLPVHNWPQVDISSNSLTAKLKTRWRNNALYYQFILLPSSHNKVKAFDTAVRNNHGRVQLTVRFYDNSGFLLCSNSISGSDMSQNIDDAGEIESLSSDGSWEYCSRDRYLESSEWNLGWNMMPNISAETEKKTPKVRASAKHEARHANPTHKGDTLSGIDVVQGQLDTESGHVFSVYESGEQYTIIGWRAGEHVESICDGRSNCVVKDTTNGQKVHAHLIR